MTTAGLLKQAVQGQDLDTYATCVRASPHQNHDVAVWHCKHWWLEVQLQNLMTIYTICGPRR